MPDSPKRFAANIRRRMAEEGWSQRDLARRSGIKQPQISKYLTGTTIPGLEICDRIAQALGTTTQELLQGGEKWGASEPVRSGGTLPADIRRMLESPEITPERWEILRRLLRSWLQ